MLFYAVLYVDPGDYWSLLLRWRLALFMFGPRTAIAACRECCYHFWAAIILPLHHFKLLHTTCWLILYFLLIFVAQIFTHSAGATEFLRVPRGRHWDNKVRLTFASNACYSILAYAQTHLLSEALHSLRQPAVTQNLAVTQSWNWWTQYVLPMPTFERCIIDCYTRLSIFPLPCLS